MRTRYDRVVAPRLAAFAAVFALLFSAGCPPPEEPPPPPPADAGPQGPAQAGETCRSDIVSRACDSGLECAAASTEGAGAFACVAPSALGGPCIFPTVDGPNPPDDGCAAGLACSSDATCVTAGTLGAACTSPTDCASVNCGTLADRSGHVCVVNECINGCGAGESCRQAGQCGLTCVAAPVRGEPCFTPGDDACAPVRVNCGSGFECFVGDLTTGVSCGAPGDEGSRCNTSTPDDGCQQGFRCQAGTNICKPINP